MNSNGQSSIGVICDYMTATYYGSPLQRLAYYLSTSSYCSDLSYSSMIETYTNEDWDSYAATSASECVAFDLI